MIGVGTDGASNLCGCNNSVYTRLKEKIPDLKLINCTLDFAASRAIDSQLLLTI